MPLYKPSLIPVPRKRRAVTYPAVGAGWWLSLPAMLLSAWLLAGLPFGVAAQEAIPHNATEARPPQLPEDISPLLIGEPVPEIMLPDKEGKLLDLNKAIAAKPAILIFYRGGWCPFCNRQLSDLQVINSTLVKKGFQVIAISTDRPGLLKSAAEEKRLDYTLLSDADVATARKFGIAYQAPKQYTGILSKSTGGMNRNFLLPVPSVFILDRKGMIRFEYINPDFKQRISAALLLAVADALYAEL